MKFKVLLFCGVFLVVASGTAAAKVAAHRLIVDGPGMRSTAAIHDGRLLDRTASVLLFRTRRARTTRPESAGAAYVLTYRFGVGDENGTRSATIHQALYPFASGGPVVFTAMRQGIDTTYGPVRFVHGWFRVPSGTLRTLQRAGLPTTEPEPATELETDRPPLTRLDGTSSRSPWLLGLGALAATATAGWQLRRHRSRRRAS
jgi:hypothetical protein